MKPGLSGYTVVRQGEAFDYPYRECIASLLPVCDEVVVGTGASTDGTDEFLADLAARDPRIRLVPYPDLNPTPRKQRDWVAKWLNFTREHLEYDMQLILDADEVLAPECYPDVRWASKLGKPRYFDYRTYWGDAWHWTPHGRNKMVRLMPSHFYIRSHAPIPPGIPDVDLFTNWERPVGIIHHYGMLRDPRKLCLKTRFLAVTLEGYGPDLLMESAVQEGLSPIAHYAPKNELFEFTGEHPPFICRWLRDRGHDPIRP